MPTRFPLFAFSTLLLVALIAPLWPGILWLLLLVIPLILVGLYDLFQQRHSLRRNFPLFGRGRWFMEWLRPFIRQYLVESDTDGAPISRMFRSIAYQRAKGAQETVPLGSQLDTYQNGYEWMGHSLSAIDAQEAEQELRVTIGGPQCRQPYLASILNISAMSFGALSRNAILALNRGAEAGGFYHNTGEGGISPYHLQGGDLVWQIGTGYFGCRDQTGHFCPASFLDQARLPAVKMIEIKLSQGAKPGHGGILPAAKNTAEIAAIRAVAQGADVLSPPTHSCFRTPLELLDFVQQLRDLADGKPIGFKLAVGRQSEFIAICKAMVRTQIYPDFITVDGGEGGTGAAPLEYTNSVGMPLREGLAFVDNCLIGFGLREHIRIIASGKILTGFHIVKNLALGADLCNSARGMMLALGCVQSLTCNTNRCPTGVATQNPALYRGLVVSDKAGRVAQFHQKTVAATADLISSAGLRHTTELTRTHIFRRVSQDSVKRYDQIYPYITPGCLLTEDVPESLQLHLKEASAESFMPAWCVTEIDKQHQTVDQGRSKTR